MNNFYGLTREEQAVYLEQLVYCAIGYWGIGGGVQVKLAALQENTIYEVACDVRSQAYLLHIHLPDYPAITGVQPEANFIERVLGDDRGIVELVPTLSGKISQVVEVDTIPQPLQCKLYNLTDDRIWNVFLGSGYMKWTSSGDQS